MDFYDQVMRELVVALGAALFLANLVALLRRRRDAQTAAARTVAGARPGSPVRGNRRDEGDTDRVLSQAPVARTVTYMLIGLVVMIWGIGSLVA